MSKRADKPKEYFTKLLSIPEDEIDYSEIPPTSRADWEDAEVLLPVTREDDKRRHKRRNRDASDHLLVQQFFAERGLIAEPIPEATTKTPDFRILRGAEVAAYCEVKSPQDVFSKRVEDSGGVIETGYGNDYRQGRCIARAAKKAEEQFKAINPNHSVPNILAILNHDYFSLEEDFTQIITGELGTVGRVGKPLRDDIPGIDAYVWMDARNKTVERVRWLFRHQNPLKEAVRDLLKHG